MEKLASSTATVPTQHFLFQLQHSLFPICAFATFHRNPTQSLSHLSSRTRHRRFQVFHAKQDQLWVGEEELKLQLKEAEEEEKDSYLDEDDSSFLSLSDKPDRNIALLDDYESEELDFDTGPDHRSGYVALLGKPNVGKSTLANQMLGQKLSIVTDKPQTTRHRILCICSGTDYQMILYDTPGVLQKEMHMLDSMMMKNVRSAAVNADCVLVLVDARKAPEKIDGLLEEGIGDLKDKPPTLLIINKKDLVKPGELAKKLEWYEKFTDVDEVIPVSAKYGQGVEDVKDWILSKIPNGPAYYPKDIVSEHPERFFGKNFLGFVVALSESFRGRKISDQCHQSPTTLAVLSIIETLTLFADETPPVAQSARYGNVAYRTWHEKMSNSAESLILKLLPENLHPATVELAPYFADSFGNASRIDYGTGHETNFAAWLYCLARLGVVGEEDYPALVARVFVKYLELMRKLQLLYCLEPAGSHGVWGLDDYHFLPFIFGSSQLIDHKYMKPKSIHNEDILENFSNEYLYLACIAFVKKVKKGVFAEHSPMLDDISGVPNWNKVNSGLLKMYKAEVLEKVPIMQHFLFGSIIKWE